MSRGAGLPASGWTAMRDAIMPRESARVDEGAVGGGGACRPRGRGRGGRPVERTGSEGPEPPPIERQLDRVELLGAHDVVAAVDGRDDPLSFGEPVDLERPCERIDEPQMADAFPRVHAHLAR